MTNKRSTRARVAAVVAAAALLVPAAAGAQIFGTLTNAAIASDGEGGVFMLGGGDVFRTGVMARFRTTKNTDLGFQGGYDRIEGENSWGAAVDFKVYMIGGESTIPVDLALDGALGHLRSDDFTRNIFQLSLLASGILRASTAVSLEPYGSIGLRSSFFSKKGPRGADGPGEWPRENDSVDNLTEALLRGGVRIHLSEEYQILAEFEIGEDSSCFGGGVNVVF
ncbi:MAG: hypothetical protein JW876_03230 [Candidatus Krumholzibacteriota bacterium]|nr:hypothetical protein [Candidatus Krumholzibacteriota bacterium]